MTPMFSFFYSHELADAFGISFVQVKEVIQSPALLNTEKIFKKNKKGIDKTFFV